MKSIKVILNDVQIFGSFGEDIDDEDLIAHMVLTMQSVYGPIIRQYKLERNMDSE